jgi:hypothetical protein
MDGMWLATGTVTSSHHFLDTPVGATFHRIWRIHTSCTNTGCQATIYRTTEDGLLVAGLGWTLEHWTAIFESTSACAYGRLQDHQLRLALLLLFGFGLGFGFEGDGLVGHGPA